MLKPLFPALCASTLALAGCASAKMCDTSTKAAAGSNPKYSNPSGLGLRLLEPGAEPRRPLRYVFEEGDRELSALELVIGTTVTSTQGAAEGLMPPIALQIEAGPVEKRSDDRYRYVIRVKDVALAVDVDPEVAEQAEDELAVLEGLGGWFEVDDRGVLRDRAVLIPEGVPRELAVMLGNVRTALMSVPLPEEAVGKGARWQTTRDVEVSGLTARQTVTYTLRHVDAKGASLEVVAHTSAPPQDVEGGRLHGYETSGMASVEIVFDRLTPLSEADLTNQMRVSVDDGSALPTAVQSRTRSVLRLYNLQRAQGGEGAVEAGVTPVAQPPAPAAPAESL